ncbi:MAG TPA: tRNA (adenine-N1)-methyltransferase [Thermoplasmata archaeon]|nr:tRNA (adenine-N1)-methyltransferase [Thermoplasmata archaeon]
MIPEGARVMLMDERDGKFMFVAERKMVEVRRLGVVDGSAVCDASYGDSISIGGRRLLIVRPSMMDIIGTIERKAQVISPKDGFAMPHYLDISCGSRVIEGGVGSGALTIVLLKSVAPAGRVYSYDLRDDHASVARRNIARAGLEDCWELKIGDICTASLEEDVDAVVLDMPDPWNAVGNVIRALRHGGHLCCYVPNANQLETAVRAMRDSGFRELFLVENLQREMIVHDGGVRPSSEMAGHTGYLAFGRKL